jgi:serine/threonine-protein kinase RsbW
VATVELSFTPLPAHVRTARLVATAVARRSGVDESLLDVVRLAVGEACSRAVEEHQLHCPAEPIWLALTDTAGRFEVEVRDNCAPAALAAAPARGSGAVGTLTSPGGKPDGTGVPTGLGIAVITGLADDVEISETSTGTSIRMSWPSAGHGQR